VKKLVRLIERATISSKPVDVTSLCNWFAFDVMAEFAFAESFGMLDNEEYHHVILMLRRGLKLLGPFSPVLWLARIGLILFPRVWRMADWNNMMAYCREKMSQRIKVSLIILKPMQDLWIADASRENRYFVVSYPRREEQWLHPGR